MKFPHLGTSAPIANYSSGCHVLTLNLKDVFERFKCRCMRTGPIRLLVWTLHSNMSPPYEQTGCQRFTCQAGQVRSPTAFQVNVHQIHLVCRYKRCLVHGDG